MKDTKVPEELKGILNIVWLFLQMDFCLLFLQFSRFKMLMKEMNEKLALLFLSFNIFLCGIWVDLSVNVYDYPKAKMFHVMGVTLPEDTVEYIGSFFVGYIILAFVIELIFYKIGEGEVNRFDVVKVVAGSSGCFLLLFMCNGCFYMIYEYIELKTGWSFNELILLFIGFKYMIWLFCVYLSATAWNNTNKFIIISSIIIVISLINAIRILCSICVERPCITKINRMVAEEYYAEKQFLYYLELDDPLIEKGHSISELYNCTEKLKDISVLTFTKRYKYKMIFIIVTLLKEDVNDMEVENVLKATLDGNFAYAHNWLMENKAYFEGKDYEYITAHKAELARVELAQLSSVREMYEKELRDEVDYDISFYSDCKCDCECDNGGKSGEYIVDEVEKVAPLYFLKYYIRLVP